MKRLTPDAETVIERMSRWSRSGMFVAYYRVSTDKQGKSGLGLEAQEAAVKQWLNGGSLLASFTEIESGKKVKRPKLAEALALCKRDGATLLIARLDRLARNVHFVSGLMETKVKFVACDMPEATPFMLHIYAAVAQEEARAISSRTKEALAAAKARGVKLGASASRWKAEAMERAEELRPLMEVFQKKSMSLRAIARELTKMKVATPRGGRWHAETVGKVLGRLD